MPLSVRQREFAEHMACCEETGMSDKAFCELIGISPHTAVLWRKKPEIVKADEALLADVETTSVLARKTFVWSLEEAIVNYRDAEGSEKRQWWRLLRDLTEPVANASAHVSYEEWTDEDLEAEFSKRGLGEVEEAIEKAKGAL